MYSGFATKTTIKMKINVSCLMLLAALFIATATTQAQTYGQQKTVQLNATVNSSAATITLNWDVYASVDSFELFRKTGTSWPSTPIATLSSSTYSYVDGTVSANQLYEYKIIGQRSTGYDAYGYIATGINIDESTNKGTIAVVVDSSLVDDLDAELKQYTKDLIGDGYAVLIYPFDTSQSGEALKDSIASIYSNYSNVTTVFLVGQLPYAYTGVMSPDGHGDHHGAWPSDMLLADIDGSYSDAVVNYTNSYDARLTNNTYDYKTDQSYLTSAVDIQIGRLDLSRLSSFSQSEVTLYKNYFNKLHNFKTGAYVPRNIGIVDDNFTSYSEGFSQNGYRNFSPLTDIDSVFNADILTTTSNSSALWSFTCGGGTFTSISGFATSSQLASNSLNGTFSLIMGSYNADPDQENNLMRSMLANGNFLTTGWAGRPNWFMHHMAMGMPIGYSTKVTQNNTNSLYTPSGYYSQMMHVMLMGDPSLKQHYTPNVENLSTIRNQAKDTAFLTWNTISGSNLGVNIYRSTNETSGYTKINNAAITTANYADAISPDTSYFYRIETMELVANNAGSYYESSVGAYIESDKNAAPLPVTLISFNAVKEGTRVALEWTVADEVDFSHYELEKFNETTLEWSVLATINARGTDNSIISYQEYDQKPVIGKNFYRLKMVDFNTDYEYSETKVVLFEEGGSLGEFVVTPSLAKNNIQIEYQLIGNSKEREFTICALDGTELMRVMLNQNDKHIDISALSQGIYFVKDVNNQGTSKKIIKVQ